MLAEPLVRNHYEKQIEKDYKELRLYLAKIGKMKTPPATFLDDLWDLLNNFSISKKNAAEHDAYALIYLTSPEILVLNCLFEMLRAYRAWTLHKVSTDGPDYLQSLLSDKIGVDETRAFDYLLDKLATLVSISEEDFVSVLCHLNKSNVTTTEEGKVVNLSERRNRFAQAAKTILDELGKSYFQVPLEIT